MHRPPGEGSEGRLARWTGVERATCPSRSRAAGAARTTAGRARASPGGSRACPPARPPRLLGVLLRVGERLLGGTSSRSSSSHGSGSGAGAGGSAGPARRLDVERLVLLAGRASADSDRLLVGRDRLASSAGSAARARSAPGSRRGAQTRPAAWRRAPRAPGAPPRRIGAASALELQMLADGVVEQSHAGRKATPRKRRRERGAAAGRRRTTGPCGSCRTASPRTARRPRRPPARPCWRRRRWPARRRRTRR